MTRVDGLRAWGLTLLLGLGCTSLVGACGADPLPGFADPPSADAGDPDAGDDDASTGD